jgi:hypothetical protein
MRTFSVSFSYLIFCFAAAAQAQPVLSDVPYWRASAGLWEGQNTYFDDTMDYNVRDYASLSRVELDGAGYRETEYRFYPQGLGTERYAGGLAQPGEGVELIQVYTGTLVDGDGTVDLPPASSRASANGAGAMYRVLSDNDAVRLRVDPETGTEAYRYYVTLVGGDHRYKSNFGLRYEGENIGGLRAFILYRDQRIDSETFDQRRAALRAKYNVTVLNEPDPESETGWKVRRIAE